MLQHSNKFSFPLLLEQGAASLVVEIAGGGGFLKLERPLLE